MAQIPDPIALGLARGWKVFNHAGRAAPARLSCDVAIVGTGAGAGITAELLTQAGLDVVMVEEGPLRSSSQFRQLESEAYPTLYQESAGRKTADQAINILQGRCVGGSTTVNWTSSFRTPAATLAFWRQQQALPGMTPEALAPWFAQAEARLSIAPWAVAPNANNRLLAEGMTRLGLPSHVIARNVKACWNLGSCGLGCPTNAKQSMLITTLPVALDRGATLLVQMRAETLLLEGSRVTGLRCQPVALNGDAAGTPVEIRARHVVVAGGAINSPALLLRSGAPDPHARLGRHTCLHPVVASLALFDQPIEGWSGAPQSMYSDHFLEQAPVQGPIGYKIESAPLHPLIAATTMAGIGVEQAKALRGFAHTQVLLALMRDGFHPEAPGGTVSVRGDGSPVLDYPLTPFVMEGARRALASMAEIQFSAGARSVRPVHELAADYTDWPSARAGIAGLPLRAHATRVVSAHVMGGCALAGRPELGVVRPDGRHWQLDNLSIHDGSLFPTSVGANPQLSIYGLVNQLATELAQALTGRTVRLA